MRQAKLLYRNIALILSISMLLSGIMFYPGVFADGKLLTMEQAVQLGIAKNSELQQADLRLQQLNMDLEQARDGIRAARAKNNAQTFVLPGDYSLPENQVMPEELGAIVKIQSALSEIKDRDRSIAGIKCKAEAAVRNAYLAVVSDIFSTGYYQSVLDGDTKALDRLTQEFKMGKATIDQVNKKKEEIEAEKQALAAEQQDLDNHKDKLGKLVGIDALAGYSFENELPFASVTEGELKTIIEESRKNSADIHKAASKLKQSSSDVYMIKEIYRREIGPEVDSIEAYLKKPGNFDYQDFKAKYGSTMDSVSKKLSGISYIPLLLYIVPVPAVWTDTQKDGIRYFKNEFVAFPKAVLEQSKDQKALEQAEADNERSITDAYNDLKKTEQQYADAAASYSKACKDYSTALQQNKTGLAAYSALDAMRKKLEGAQLSVFNLLISYDKQLYSLDYQSGGALKKYLGSTKITFGAIGIDIKTRTANPISENKKEAAAPAKPPEWFIDFNNEELGILFRLNVPEALGINYYSIFTPDGRQLGKKTKVTESIRLLPVLLVNNGGLTIKLYKDDKLLGTAGVDGTGSGGELVIIPPESK